MPDIFLLEGAPNWYAYVMRVLLILGTAGFCVSTIFWSIEGLKRFGERLPFWQGFSAGISAGFIVTLAVLCLIACVLQAVKAA